MIKITTLVLLLLASLPVSAESFGKLWQLSRQTDNVWLWKFKGRPDVIGTLQSNSHARPLDWKAITSEQFFENLTDKKRTVLRLIGISNWKVHSSNWEKNPQYHQLYLSGSYLDSQQVPTRFIEMHYYFPHKSWQILLTFPESKKLNSKMTQLFLNSMKKMVREK